ncbi:hypothetical protein EV127DRAFT_317556, partial [Xylaria flabelliformis]
MASSSTPVSGSKQTQTSSTSGTGRSRRSTAYDKNFAQICIDHRICPQNHVSRDDGFALEPANLDDICRALKGSKSSPPPETDFKAFQKINVSPFTEGTVTDTLVPLLTGLNTDILKSSNLLFNNLTSLTDNLTVVIKPDFCDGACPEDVDLEIRRNLCNIIRPNKRLDFPLAQNFFFEAKAPEGSISVSDRQAMLDGAYGARAMHALQNYGMKQTIYDGNAYTFSATFITKVLQLYAHHVVAPTTPGRTPRYCMTSIDGYWLGKNENYSEAVRALRNLRVIAQEARNRFIKVANTRA